MLVQRPATLLDRLPDGSMHSSHKPLALDFAVINALGPGHWDDTWRTRAGRKRQFHSTEQLCLQVGIQYKPIVLESHEGYSRAAFFADFSFEVASLSLRLQHATFFVLEQPEDLGAMPKGPRKGQRPATMWQWPQCAELVRKGLRTAAFHQSQFGMGYHKPTRLLLKTGLAFPDFVHEGLPTFDKQGYYTGPLPPLSTSPTKTRPRMVASAATAQWPSKMAEWLAQLALATCAAPATTAVPERGDPAPIFPTKSPMARETTTAPPTASDPRRDTSLGPGGQG